MWACRLIWPPEPPDHKLARKDNTIALVEARKARQREEVKKAEEPLKPFVKRKEQVVKTEQPPSRTQGFEVTPELAAGWTLVDSDALVTPLFVHKSSGCTTVKLPKKSIMDFSERKGLKLPIGWKTLKDNESGRVYYWNSRSGAVQWVQPSSAK